VCACVDFYFSIGIQHALAAPAFICDVIIIIKAEER